MATVASNRSIQFGIYAVVALLLLAAIFHASGPASSITQHASWAYKPKTQSTYEEHAAEKHTQYDNDVYDDELDSNSTAKSPGPSSALVDEEDAGGAHISSSISNDENGHGKWAYATFLSTSQEDKPDDSYFTACRTLVYQLLHHPKTKTKRNIPLLILTPPHAHTRKLDMLTDEGAKVIKVEAMDIGDEDWTDKSSGMKASSHFARLRMWEMSQYTRILYIDAATLLMRPIDEIFDEAVVKGNMRALSKIESSAGFDELGVTAPKEYFMAGVSDTKNSKHEFPPPDENWMSPGFYMLKPDTKVYKYLESMVKVPDQFDKHRLMAGLLNHAHRRDGKSHSGWSQM